MKRLISFTVLLISICVSAQRFSDSLDEASFDEMAAYFIKLDSSKLSLNVRTDLQFQKVRSFLTAHPEKSWAPLLISWGRYFDSLKIDTLYNLLDSSVRERMKENIKHQKIRSLITQGMTFPEMILTDALDQPFSISSLKGKIVFIDIWSSTCKPCREEMPDLIKLYEKYKDKGFVVIGISLDDDKTKWINAIKKDQQPWQQFCELKPWPNTYMFKKWGITWMPYNFLIGRDGKLVDKEIPIRYLEEMILSLQ